MSQETSIDENSVEFEAMAGFNKAVDAYVKNVAPARLMKLAEHQTEISARQLEDVLTRLAAGGHEPWREGIRYAALAQITSRINALTHLVCLLTQRV